MTTTVATKMQQLLETLPQDLSRMIVLSGLSLKPETVARAVEIAVAIHALRKLDEARALAGDKAERIVENTMADFQSRLEKIEDAK